jgi:lysozyme
MIPGIDVSHWQGVIDWAKIAQSGVKFAFIKATEFPDRRISVFVDQNLKSNINGAVENKILWGAYHFFRTHIDPVIQARVFCEAVGQFNSLPPVLDLEVAGSKGTQLNEKVHSFVKEVQRITNRRPIIYSSGGFWRSYMMYNRRSDTDWAQAYPLWLAQYTTTWPTMVYPWASWDFWQYSSSGRLPGIPGNVDLNWYIGSQEELVNYFINDNRSKTLPKDESLMRIEDEKKIPQEEHTIHTVTDGQHSLDPFNEEESDDDWIKRYFFSNSSDK